MKKECRISSFIVVLCFNIFSQDYKHDSLAVRAILDYVSANSLKSLPAEIGQLNNLDRLYLEMNQITSLPRTGIHERCIFITKNSHFFTDR